MAITLDASSLPGIIARKEIGEYLIDASNFIEKELDEEGNILSTIWAWTKGIAGFLWKGVVGLLKMVFSMDFRSLFAKLVNFTQFTISFDFGASDASLAQQVEALKLGVSSQLGGFAGQAAGWFLGGALPGFAIFAFNEVAGLNVLKEVGQEALEELADSLYALTQAIWRLKSRELFIRSFKNVRKWLKQPNNPFYAFLPESLKKAWAEGKSWRISDRVELAVESIQDAQMEAFVEEALDEFGDSFLEAGYVVAGGLDKYVAEQKRKKTEQVLEVTPNREYPNEKFLLAGHETELRATLPLILANHEIIDHRDIGVVSAVDPTQLITQAQPLELYCRIEWRSPLGNAGPRPSYQISSAKRSKLSDYAFIRQVAGGSNGYLWGRYKAVASMSDGHFITCYGGTEDAAEERALALTTLSDADVQVINVTEEKRSAVRLTIKGLRKESTQVQPYRIIITNRKYYTEPHPGSRASKRGYFIPISAALSIRSPTKPADWDQRIAQILLGPTVSNPG